VAKPGPVQKKSAEALKDSSAGKNKEPMNPSFGPGDPSESILHPKGPFVLAPANNGQAMDLGQLEQLALLHNPTLKQAALLVQASRAKAQQARLWPNPSVAYFGDQINQKGSPGEFQGGYIEQEIITAHKRKLSGAKYDQQAETAEARAAEQELKVLNGIRMQYFRVLAEARRLGLRKALLDNAAEEYRTTLEESNIGKKNKAHVLLAANDWRQAKIELQSQVNSYDLKWRQLVVLAGAPEFPAGGLLGKLEPQGAALDYQTNLARILDASPEIMVAKSHVRFEELTLQREKAETRTNVFVRGGVGYNYPDNNTVGQVQIRIEPRLWNRNQGNIRQAETDLARGIADIRRVELSLEKRLAERFDKYQNARLLAEVYGKENVPAAYEAFEIYLDQYKKRRIEWLEVVKIHKKWLAVQLQYIEMLEEMRRQEVAICGLLAVDGLDAPPAPPPPGHLGVSPQPR
jgi:outer membrane protein TolC